MNNLSTTTEPARTGAAFNRAESNQDWATPPEFIKEVEMRFGNLNWDLAATQENAKAPKWITPEQDSLAMDWTPCFGNLWLNPPFRNIGVWASKCKAYACAGRRIFLLTPASVSTDWFAEYVQPNAMVLAIRPRLKFVGATDAYPKDLMLSCFGLGIHGFDVWKWK